MCQLAEDAVCIGSAPASESYLSIDRILQRQEITECDGDSSWLWFFAENPEFVRRYQENDFIFIGPTAEVMELWVTKQMHVEL